LTVKPVYTYALFHSFQGWYYIDFAADSCLFFFSWKSELERPCWQFFLLQSGLRMRLSCLPFQKRKRLSLALKWN